MGRKLTGRKIAGKALKGTLQSHLLRDQRKKKNTRVTQDAQVVSANKEKAGQKDQKDQKDQKHQGQKDQKDQDQKEKKDQKEDGAPKPTVRKTKAFIPFDKDETLLLVGEGDFSYAVSILQNGYVDPENLVATGFDSEAQVLQKYPTAAENLQLLKDYEVKVLHDIDATDLVGTLKIAKKRLLPRKLNHIMFNFPHTGRGMTDTNRNIRDHQKLVLGYFESAKKLLQAANEKQTQQITYFEARSEKILLTVFEGEPYISWGIKSLARSIGFKVERSGAFVWEAYPGYSHRRTDGTGNTTKKAAERSARTYVFTKFVKTVEEKPKADDSDSD